MKFEFMLIYLPIYIQQKMEKHSKREQKFLLFTEISFCIFLLKRKMKKHIMSQYLLSLILQWMEVDNLNFSFF